MSSSSKKALLEKDFEQKVAQYNQKHGTNLSSKPINALRVKDPSYLGIRKKYEREAAQSMILAIYMYAARGVVKAYQDNPNFLGIRFGRFGLIASGKKVVLQELKFKDRIVGCVMNKVKAKKNQRK
ncbi:MAG: hypothetical protein RML94_00120 [Bacteroidia bacterium]|nr:hypothetical protein [Bacteroidia bacterium]